MDNIAIQSPAVVQGARNFQGLQGLLGGGMGDGGFLDLIMQLMDGMMDPQLMQDALMGMPGMPGMAVGQGMAQPLEESAGDDDDSEADPWMQMFASMMAADGMSFAVMPETVSAAGLQQIVSAAGAGDGRAKQILSAVFSMVDQGKGTAQGEEQTQEGDPIQVVQQPSAAEGQGQQQGKSASDSSLFWNGQFRNSVSEAQKLIKNQPQEAGAETVDVESLQGDVNSGKFVSVEASRAKELPPPQAKDVAEQVRTGIIQNMDKGKNEFVVRLKPAGLGEIMVHMASDGGKMVLSLVASSEQTARLLNSEMTGLRESLRPLGAEVREVVAQPQQNSAYTSFDASQQQHQQQQQQENENLWRRQQGYFVEDDGPQEEPQGRQVYAGDGIDTYI